MCGDCRYPGEMAQQEPDDEAPEQFDGSPEPPEWWLEVEAAEHARLHDDQYHGGGPCDCPAAPVIYSDEPPY